VLPGGIGFWEIAVILVVVLLVMGPNKIPEVARTLGKGLRAARRAGQELRDAIDPEEYKRPFRAWEVNHEIDEAEVYDRYECPEDQKVADSEAAPEMEQPVTVQPEPVTVKPGVVGTVSRGDILPNDPIDEGASGSPEGSSGGPTNGA